MILLGHNGLDCVVAQSVSTRLARLSYSTPKESCPWNNDIRYFGIRVSRSWDHNPIENVEHFPQHLCEWIWGETFQFSKCIDELFPRILIFLFPLVPVLRRKWSPWRKYSQTRQACGHERVSCEFYTVLQGRLFCGLRRQAELRRNMTNSNDEENSPKARMIWI